MKYEWRKKEKAVYLPKNKPEEITLPEYKFITINGAGNPNNPIFSEYISALYSVAYAIKMGSKKMKLPPKGYYDFTVYPLEGIWDLNKQAKKDYDGVLNKDDLVFKLMIRQPDFVNDMFFTDMLSITKEKKPNPLLEKVRFETISEGHCVQMLHIGPYDDEPESFKIMEQFAESHHLERLSKAHREIYLSDFRKVAPEKLKTVLRFQVK